ncbi:hypothetical protein PR048_030955 [Dryococelus australis]|uniref:HTH psq-type domain-containing protein n=1 Tax=Dryococelus australis TaxID=614101 RepID=A0ABQ9GAB7_9NEOP|nr:hypothetical protein PR048_030955 [Dryococelus australis]
MASRKAMATEEQQVKTQQAEWTEEQLQEAMESVNSGTLSVNKADSVFPIPRRTFQNHLKTGSNVRKLGRQIYLSLAEENELRVILTVRHQQNVLARRGAKSIQLVAPEREENVTVEVTAIPPVILLKGQRLKLEWCNDMHVEP